MVLKDLEARYAKRGKDYKFTDGKGLYLLVRLNGSKLWRSQYTAFAGKEKLLSFGQYPSVGLAGERLQRAEAKIALGQG